MLMYAFQSVGCGFIIIIPEIQQFKSARLEGVVKNVDNYGRSLNKNCRSLEEVHTIIYSLIKNLLS